MLRVFIRAAVQQHELIVLLLHPPVPPSPHPPPTSPPSKTHILVRTHTHTPLLHSPSPPPSLPPLHKLVQHMCAGYSAAGRRCERTTCKGLCHQRQSEVRGSLRSPARCGTQHLSLQHGAIPLVPQKMTVTSTAGRHNAV